MARRVSQLTIAIPRLAARTRRLSMVMVTLMLLQALGILSFFHTEGCAGELEECYHYLTEHAAGGAHEGFVSSLADDESTDNDNAATAAPVSHSAHPCHFFHGPQFVISHTSPTIALGRVVLAFAPKRSESAKDGCTLSLFRPPRLA